MPTYFVKPIKLQTNRRGLAGYLKKEILPRYSVLDIGHNQNHIYAVLKNAYELNEKLTTAANNNLVTAAVFYHDLGVMAPTKAGRANHEATSAAVVRADENLLEFFSDAEIEQIALACQQHRASFKGKRTDLLSKLVADADTIDSLNFKRILAYATLAWCPGSDRETILRHMYDHYSDKHGRGSGYAGVDLEISYKIFQPKREFLWEISRDYKSFRQYFLENYGEWFD